MANKSQTSKILIIICVITFFCIFSCAVSWYFPLDPVSPPQTNLDDVPSFNALFEDTDDKWIFIFKKDDKYYFTDIYGHKDEVILDIVRVTNNLNAELLYDESISPDNRFLAVNYYTGREPSGPPNGKLLIFDLKDHSIIDITLSLDGFKFDWTRPVFWLDSNIFLVKMHRYPGPDMFSEVVSLIVFDIRSLDTPQVIEFEPCDLLLLMKNDTHVLVVSDEWCAHPDEIQYWAIDLQGKRLANSDEVEYYNEIMSDDNLWEESKEFSLCEDCPTIRIEPVIEREPPMDELISLPDWADELLAGRYEYNNYWRDFIYLDDKLVRITDRGCGGILWDSDLQLFFFNEGYQDDWFLMDIYGHYRFLYEGEYIGKIPKTILSDE